MFASNPHQVSFRQPNKENGAVTAKNNDVVKQNPSSHHGSVSKTPAASNKQRRALGDISNRKPGRGQEDSSLPRKTQTPSIRLLQPLQERNGNLTKTPGPTTKRPGVTFLPRPTQQAKQISSVKFLPDTKHNNEPMSTKQRSLQKSILKSNNNKGKTFANADDAVDDIELSAGRLYIDEPEDDSIASVSLPGALTVREDWIAASRKRHAFRLQKNLEKEQREETDFDNYLANLFENDEKAILGTDVWIERTMSFDDGDLDDELSFDAPSCCVDISF